MDLPPLEHILDADWLTRYLAEHGMAAFEALLRCAAETYGGAVTGIAATLLTPRFPPRLIDQVGLDVRRTLAYRLFASSWSPATEGPGRYRREGWGDHLLSDTANEFYARRGESVPPDRPLPTLSGLRLHMAIDQAWVAHAEGIWGCDVSSDGRYVVSGSRDGTVAVWA